MDKHLETIYQLGTKLVLLHDQDAILQQTLKTANDVLDLDAIVYGQVDEIAGELVYSHHLLTAGRLETINLHSDLSNEQDLGIAVVNHRQAMYVPDSQQDVRYALEPQDLVWRSALCVPLCLDERVLGVLTASNTKPNRFSPNDQRLLQTLAGQTAVALENARLHTAMRSYADRMVQLHQISQALTASLDYETIVRTALTHIQHLFGAQGALLLEPDLENNKHCSIQALVAQAWFEFTWDLGANQDFAAWALAQRQPVLVEDVLDDPDLEQKLNPHLPLLARSLMSVPLLTPGRDIGTVQVVSDTPGMYTRRELNTLQTIAVTLAIVLENAYLYRQQEQLVQAREQAQAALYNQMQQHAAELEQRVTKRTQQLRQANEELAREKQAAETANQAKSIFLANISHELRTPLTSVLGFAKLVENRLQNVVFSMVTDPDAKTKRAMGQINANLHIIVSEGERLTTLINDVLDLAKLDAGQIRWKMTQVSLQEIVEQAIAATASLFEAKPLKLIVDVQDGLPTIVGDHGRLIQVLVNLLSNAVKFTPKGIVTCQAWQSENDKITVSVQDTGIGIAPADHQRVFEKFVQLCDILTGKPQGTGLGLPICKDIVTHHGGRIWVESSLGQGSTFFFALPIPTPNFATGQFQSRMTRISE